MRSSSTPSSPSRTTSQHLTSPIRRARTCRRLPVSDLARWTPSGTSRRRSARLGEAIGRGLADSSRGGFGPLRGDAPRLPPPPPPPGDPPARDRRPPPPGPRSHAPPPSPAASPPPPPPRRPLLH